MAVLLLVIGLAGCQGAQTSSLSLPQFKTPTVANLPAAPETAVVAQGQTVKPANTSVVAAADDAGELQGPMLGLTDSKPEMSVDVALAEQTIKPIEVPTPAAPNRVKKPKVKKVVAKKKLVGPVRKGQRRVAAIKRSSKGKKLNFFERAALRKSKYSHIVAKHARAHGVPVHLAMAIIEIESSFRPKATGKLGEVGLMQLRPRTARGLGYRGSMKALYDPDTNVRVGMKYLAEAHRRGGGKTCGTILKYNAGHYAKRMNPVSARYCRRVKKVMAKNASLGV